MREIHNDKRRETAGRTSLPIDRERGEADVVFDGAYLARDRRWNGRLFWPTRSLRTWTPEGPSAFNTDEEE